MVCALALTKVRARQNAYHTYEFTVDIHVQHRFNSMTSGVWQYYDAMHVIYLWTRTGRTCSGTSRTRSRMAAACSGHVTPCRCRPCDACCSVRWRCCPVGRWTAGWCVCSAHPLSTHSSLTLNICVCIKILCWPTCKYFLRVYENKTVKTTVST